MLKHKRKGQSAIEYTVLLVIIIGAFIAIQNYLKRGIQGRMKDAVDSLGEQYDPRTASTSVIHSITSMTNTEILGLQSELGDFTQRTDKASSTETVTGSTTVGAY